MEDVGIKNTYKKGKIAMYIGEVIRRAQNYCPSEYDENEMYSWCDEVSSMLAIEDRNVFVKEVFVPDSDGNVLLPAGAGFENIISVTVNGRQLKKEDLRNRRCSVNVKTPVEVIYLLPYSPIRVVSYTGNTVIDKKKSQFTVGTDGFKIGDSINVELNSVTAELHVLDIQVQDNVWSVSVADGSLDDFADTGIITVNRIITDKTICDAPYDGMYIDYIIAKICMYQRDFNTYNQFMTSFNSRLKAYKRWITNQLPQAGGKLKNWW